MSVPVTLRPMRDDDVDHIAAIWQAAWRASHAGIEQVPDDMWYFTQALGVARTARGLLAVAGGVPVGFATWRGDELERIFVAPDAPRAGVGGTLLAAAEFAMGRSGTTGWLHCREGNSAARSFFERHGWTVSGTEQVAMYDGPVACWRMTKGL